eukprot:3671727-Pleurochrysis_carterae.AAC.2
MDPPPDVGLSRNPHHTHISFPPFLTQGRSPVTDLSMYTSRAGGARPHARLRGDEAHGGHARVRACTRACPARARRHAPR